VPNYSFGKITKVWLQILKTYSSKNKLNTIFVNTIMQNSAEKSIHSLIAGMINVEKLQFDKACQCFDKSITQTEDNEIAWFAKAMTYKKMGKIDEAKGCLKVAMMPFNEIDTLGNSQIPPVIEFFLNKTLQREVPKLDFII
jgi:tetratricopeptide (TPR) repeat protein